MSLNKYLPLTNLGWLWIAIGSSLANVLIRFYKLQVSLGGNVLRHVQ